MFNAFVKVIPDFYSWKADVECCCLGCSYDVKRVFYCYVFALL